MCSLLSDFICNHLSEAVEEISFFCDGCSGQNKNYTVLRFLYSLVHDRKRFKSVKVFFSLMRGRFCMECDRDFANINTDRDVDIPEHWLTEFAAARVKSSSFNIIKAT